MDDLERSIKDYIAREFLLDKPAGLLDRNLVEEGVVDSLGIMSLIAFIEKELGARIKPEDVVVENFETVTAIARLVKQRRTA